MNANNVYIGVTLDNEEILLYRESSDKVINLMTKEYVEPSDVQVDKLIPYTRLKDTKHQLKGTIIRTFEKDRSEKLDVSNIFIGDIYQTESNTFLGYDNFGCRSWKVHSNRIKKDALLYLLHKGETYTTVNDIDFYESKFIDLETCIIYDNKDEEKEGGLFIAPKMKPYLSVVEYDGPIEEKRMVLKKYRERRGK